MSLGLCPANLQIRPLDYLEICHFYLFYSDYFWNCFYSISAVKGMPPSPSLPLTPTTPDSHLLPRHCCPISRWCYPLTLPEFCHQKSWDQYVKSHHSNSVADFRHFRAFRSEIGMRLLVPASRRYRVLITFPCEWIRRRCRILRLWYSFEAYYYSCKVCLWWRQPLRPPQTWAAHLQHLGADFCSRTAAIAPHQSTIGHPQPVNQLCLDHINHLLPFLFSLNYYWVTAPYCFISTFLGNHCWLLKFLIV